MNTNSNTKLFKIYLALFILIISAVSVSALSIVGEFENKRTTISIMPGDSVGYYVLVTADQNLSQMNISGRLWDITTSEDVFLGELFSDSTSNTFYYPSQFFVTSEDYQNLPGKYIIELFAEEKLTYGYYTSKVAELQLTVIGNRPPVADFIYYPQNITTATSVRFNSTSYDPDGFIVRYEWFVDGAKISEGANIVHTFNRAGTYEVTLRVTDNDGATDSHTETIVVSQGPITGYPVANFTNSSNLCEDENIVFTSTSYDIDGNIVLEEWDFNNDGIYEIKGHVVSRLFQNEGTFPISLKVTDDRGLVTIITKTFQITECGEEPTLPPVANFTYLPSQVCVNEQVEFQSNSYDPDGFIVEQQWDLNGDGIVDRTGSRISWTYTTTGFHMVTLTVRDNQGVRGSLSRLIIVEDCEQENIPPVANFTYQPRTNITTETLVSFISTSYDVDGTIVSENWYVDGAFAGTAHELNFLFIDAGQHLVTLRVFDDDGASDSYSEYIMVIEVVIPNIPPVADFIYFPLQPTTLTAIDFESTSYDVDGEIVLERWYIDSVFVGTGDEMSTVLSEGVHTVTLIVYDDDGASDSETKFIIVTREIIIENIPPVADFDYTPTNPTIDDLVVFSSASYDPDGIIVSYEWFIDGELVATTEEMLHIFPSVGTYEVTLRVTDDDGATDSETKDITVGLNPCLPHAVLRVHESVLVGEVVPMDALLSTANCGQTIIAYRWEVLCSYDYTMVMTTIPYYNHTFPQTGECRVVLTVFTDAGLSDSDEKRVFAGRPARGIQQGSEDDLYVEQFDIIGSDYGEIECGELFTVTGTISNDRGEDLRNLKLTFSIPEIGYQIESEKFSLKSGSTRTISLHGYLDYMVGELPAGEYVALVGVSDSDTVREKYFPLIIK